MAGSIRTDVDKAGRRHSRGSHLRVVIDKAGDAKAGRGSTEGLFEVASSRVRGLGEAGRTTGIAITTGNASSIERIDLRQAPSASEISRALRTLADAVDAAETSGAGIFGLRDFLTGTRFGIHGQGNPDVENVRYDTGTDAAAKYASGWLSVMGDDGDNRSGNDSDTKSGNGSDTVVTETVPTEDGMDAGRQTVETSPTNDASLARAFDTSWETRTKATADASARGTRYANKVVWEANGQRMTAYGPKTAGIVRAFLKSGDADVRPVLSDTAAVVAMSAASLVPAPGMSPLAGPEREGEAITAYTDGSASPLIIGEKTWLSRVGARRSGMGVRFLERGIERTYLGGVVADGPVVSNEIEMLTAMSAIRAAVSAGYRSIELRYDCSALASTWEGKSETSRDTVTRQFSVMRDVLRDLGVTVTLVHVKGHAGELNNEQCDAVAKAAAWAAQQSFRDMAMRPDLRLDGIPGIGSAIKANAAKEGKAKGSAGKQAAVPKVNRNGIPILDDAKGKANGAKAVGMAKGATTKTTAKASASDATQAKAADEGFIDPETLPLASMCHVSDESAAERRRTTKALLIAACRDLGLSDVGRGLTRTTQYDGYGKIDGIGKSTGKLLTAFLKAQVPSNRDTNIWKDVATFLAGGWLLEGVDDMRQWREVAIILAVAVANGCSTDKALRVAQVRKTGQPFNFPGKVPAAK